MTIQKNLNDFDAPLSDIFDMAVDKDDSHIKVEARTDKRSKNRGYNGGSRQRGNRYDKKNLSINRGKYVTILCPLGI